MHDYYLDLIDFKGIFRLYKQFFNGLFSFFSFLSTKIYKVQRKIKFARIPLCACAQNCVWGFKGGMFESRKGRGKNVWKLNCALEGGFVIQRVKEKAEIKMSCYRNQGRVFIGFHLEISSVLFCKSNYLNHHHVRKRKGRKG